MTTPSASWRVFGVGLGLGLSAALLASGAAPAEGGPPPPRGDAFAQAKAKYEEFLARPSLVKRTRGRERFAATGDLRALAILATSYDRPEEPKDEVQYLLADICTNHFSGADALDAYADWRGRDGKAADAWLWYRTLRVALAFDGGKEEAERVARGGADPFLRAAAIEALAAKDQIRVLPLAADLLAALPADPVGRALIVEACASGVLAQSAHLGEDVFHEPAARLIRQLDDPATLPRTKRVIARFLSRVFDTPKRFLEARPWHRLLLHAEAEQEEKAPDDPYAPPAPPTFIGIEASGTRIAYLIDASDSMMTPVTGKEIVELKKPRGEVTPSDDDPAPDLGKRGGMDGGGGEDPPKDPLPTEGQVEWKKVKTRFDAARALLELSLRALPADASFTVILFGSKAEPLESTRGMVPATAAAVSRTIGELRAIKPGSATPDRPMGRIRGDTNVHGALHRAFKVKNRGLVGPYEYVSPEAFLEGCDTVFVLSDGAPTTDDWPASDKRDPEDHAGDPETGKSHADLPTLVFQGPFGFGGYVPEEVRRLNLFRRAEIHCIGIGEANAHLLGQIAQIGMGKFRSIGSLATPPPK